MKIWINILSFLKNNPYKGLSIVLFIIVMLQYCSRRQPRPVINTITLPAQAIKVKRDYVPQPIKIEKLFKNIPIYNTIFEIDSFPMPIDVDTNAILATYFASFSYVDTLQNDSLAYIVVKDMITQNRIANRTSIIKVFPLTSSLKPKRKLYAGIGIGGNETRFIFSGKMLYVDRNDRIFGLAWYPTGNMVELSAYWKIRLKKKIEI